MWQTPLEMRSAKRRHQSPEWTILSHSYRLIQWEIVWSQVLLDSLHLRSSRTSWWFPPVLRRGSSYDTPNICVYDFQFDLNTNLGPILPRFRDTAAFVLRKPLFRYPSPIPVKVSGCSAWSRSVMLGSAESEHPKLTNCGITFEDFQHMWSG